MYKIALCDDEQIHIEKINKDLHAIMDAMGVPYEIDAFTSGREFLAYSGKLSDILKELPDTFFAQCHKSYAVNIKHITSLNLTSAVTIHQESVPISRSYSNNIRAAFTDSLDSQMEK